MVTSIQMLRAIARDVRGGLTLVKALEKRGLGEHYHSVRNRMTQEGLQTRPDAAASYEHRVPVSPRARACATLWNDGYTIIYIAAMQGISKQAVSRVLKTAERQGLLTRPTVGTARRMAAQFRRAYPEMAAAFEAAA